MSAPTDVESILLDRVKSMEEFTMILKEFKDFIGQKAPMANDVLQMILDGSHVVPIAKHVVTMQNAAENDRTTANVDIDDDGINVTSDAPLGDDYLIFVGVFVDVPTKTMTLQDTLNTVKFRYQIRDNAPATGAAAAAAAATSKTPGAGSSSSAIDLLDDDEDEDPVPPPKTSAANAKKRKADQAMINTMINTAVPSDAASVRSGASAPNTTRPSAVGSPVVGGKAKLSNLQILGSPELKSTLDALVGKRMKVSDPVNMVYHNKFVDTLNKLTRPQLQEVAERMGMEVNKNQLKGKLAKDIATETCQFAVNELNDGRV